MKAEDMASALMRINANYELAPGIHSDIRNAAALIRQQAAEIERLKSEREYIVGFNDGWDDLAAQLRFPVMLRKMWSGSEVQKWIDQATARSAMEASDG